MWLAIHLWRKGKITADQLCEATAYCFENRPAFGLLALRKGHLTMKQLFLVLEAQVDDPRPIGRIARDLRFLTKRQVAYLLLEQEQQMPQITEQLVRMNAITQSDLMSEMTSARGSRCKNKPTEDLESTAPDTPRPVSAEPYKVSNES